MAVLYSIWIMGIIYMASLSLSSAIQRREKKKDERRVRLRLVYRIYRKFNECIK